MENAKLGEIAWLDLTVQDAAGIRDFYQDVIGWNVEEVPMGDYVDYSMFSKASGQPASGICHARGFNADIPPMWLPYFLVVDVELSAKAVQKLGGTLCTDIKSMGSDKFVVIKDPAGAACALYQKG